VVIVLGIAGALIVTFNLIKDLAQRNIGIIAVYVLAFLWIVLITWLKDFPYHIRAYSLLIITYLLSVFTLIQQGIPGNGRIWLLGYIVIAAILLGFNSGVIALIISTVSILGIGFLMNQGNIVFPSPEKLPSNSVLLDWVNTDLAFLLLGIMIVGSILVLVQGLRESLLKQKSLNETFMNDHEQLERQTSELNRRLIQIRAAGEISRALGSMSDPSVLFQKFVEMVRSCFNLYFVGIFLIDELEETIYLHAATGDIGKKMIEDVFRLSLDESSSIGWTIKNRRPLIEVGMELSTRRLNHPLLSIAHSGITLPLISGDDVYGSMIILSEEYNAFDENDIPVLRGITDCLGLSYQNARLFQQKEKNLQEISSLNRQFTAEAWEKFNGIGGVDHYIYDNDEFQGQNDPLASITFPLSLRDHVLGHITLELDKQSLSLEELDFVEQVTTQATLAMENVRLLEEAQRHAGQNRQVADVVQKARASTEVDTILRVTLAEISRMLNASESVIQLDPIKLEGGISSRDVEKGNRAI
jgi:GAF domain-containing protein